jgi:hypothetical protein
LNLIPDADELEVSWRKLDRDRLSGQSGYFQIYGTAENRQQSYCDIGRDGEGFAEWSLPEDRGVGEILLFDLADRGLWRVRATVVELDLIAEADRGKAVRVEFHFGRGC